MRTQSTIVPGYCVVQQPGTLDFQARLLFNNANSEAARYFMQLNRDTHWVKPGQILIVADPNNSNQAYQLNHLSMAKKQINAAMVTTDNNTAEFLNKNYERIAALTSLGDKIAGTVGDVGEKYFRQIQSILVKIEKTYQNQFRTQGSLIGQQFYVERNVLFSQLKPLLNNVSRVSLKINNYENIKRALGLSSRSIVHEWSTVGVGAIPGYVSYISRAAKAASFMKAGGWVALGFSFMNTSNDVYHACTSGRENECGKVAVKKYSMFGGGVAGAAGGAWAATLGSGALCGAIGIPTVGVGTMVCGIIVGIGATSAGAWFGTRGGEEIGDGINRLVYSGD
ncbi:MAG TPA: hypothetical protein DC012_02870 [Escherichia sp.]|uniref:hypothetical protein n=1 Tax=Pseudescherichia vulneris TaxID=566 RepID=UPI000E96599C|nr:hypothetical protein [Pseudescherichia vulneris]HBC80913.1 hypothetical protein [Escherichia sp.]